MYVSAATEFNVRMWSQFGTLLSNDEIIMKYHKTPGYTNLL